MKSLTFEQDFQRRVAEVEAEAAELGESWSSICREVGCSRATPDRWKRSTPKTVRTLDQMQAYLARRRKDLVQQALVQPKT